MRDLIASIEAEYRRYKTLGEGAINQLADSQLAQVAGTGNSIVTIVWHLAGNLKSRFTDFLTSDGEKPWRDRDSEFLARAVSRKELQAKWEDGWSSLRDTARDRKSKRLNSSHTVISYAVFCLKKKKKN